MDSHIQVNSTFRLQVVVYATTAVSVDVSSRVREAGADKVPGLFNIAPGRISTDGAANYFYFTLPGNSEIKGELLNATVGLVTPNVQRGQCFIRVGLTIGGVDGSAVTPFRILFSDYVTSNSFLAYPGSGIKDSLDGVGYLHFLDISTLQIGTPVTLAGNRLYQFHSLIAEVTTDATVGNRKLAIQYDNGEIALLGVSSSNIAASQSRRFTFGRSLNTQIDYPLSEKTTGELYNIKVNGNAEISALLENAAGSDTVTGVSAFVETWIKA